LRAFRQLFRRIWPANNGLKGISAADGSTKADHGANLARCDRYLRRWSDSCLRNGSGRNSEKAPGSSHLRIPLI
jgi:hypothetical protein